MLKTLTAIGIGAAIALAPLAAIAQDQTPAAAPAATDNMAPAKDSMKSTKKHTAKKHHMAKKEKAAKPADDAAPAAPAEAPKN